MNIKSIADSFYVDAMSMKSKHSYLMALVLIAAIFALKSMSFLYLPTIISVLFMNDEKGIRATSFAPVNKKSSVYGRYMFVLLSFVLCLAINLTADLVVPHFYAAYISGGMFFYILMSVLFFALVSIELPLLYWKGYAQSRIILFAILFGVIFPIVKADRREKLLGFLTNLRMNPQFTLSLIAAAIVLLLCSLLISAKIYTQKDI
ncbi:MAG TPA: ABC-2 transporter permease [Candidatus Acidoferrum sp.]|nr:ABC-2 transporter permease [Candidatus Acidoferrum sp.]